MKKHRKKLFYFSGFKTKTFVKALLLFIGIGISAMSSACNLHANFTYILGADGLATFTNTTTGNDTNATFTWNPGDGSPSAHTRNYSHTYTANGTYSVTLTVQGRGPDSCSSVVTKRITISNVCNLHANFTFVTGADGLVTFTNTTTGADTNATYTWNPGDGSSNGHTKNYSHTYTHDTTFYVTLTVQDRGPDSCYGTITKKVTITNVCNLLANFTFVKDSNGLVVFTNTTTGADSNAIYTWNPGDGGNDGHTKNYSHTYTHDTTYYVTLTVQDRGPDSCYGTITKKVTITNIPVRHHAEERRIDSNACNVHANFTYVIGADGHVTFTNTSTGTDVSSIYTWNPGDGSSYGHTRNYNHTYMHDTTYSVTLTVQDSGSDSCKSTITKRISITNICNVQANFTITKDSNGYVVFTNTTTGADSNATYTWNPGDGSSNGHTRNYTHTYTHDTTYYVTLTVQDGAPDSCYSSVTKKVTITNARHSHQMSHFEENDNSSSLAVQPEFVLSPNPSRGMFNVSISNLSNEEQPVEIEVVNVMGEVVYKSTVTTPGYSLKAQLQLQNVPSGIYIVRAVTQTEVYANRIVISK